MGEAQESVFSHTFMVEGHCCKLPCRLYQRVGSILRGGTVGLRAGVFSLLKYAAKLPLRVVLFVFNAW